MSKVSKHHMNYVTSHSPWTPLVVQGTFCFTTQNTYCPSKKGCNSKQSLRRIEMYQPYWCMNDELRKKGNIFAVLHQALMRSMSNPFKTMKVSPVWWDFSGKTWTAWLWKTKSTVGRESATWEWKIWDIPPEKVTRPRHEVAKNHPKDVSFSFREM